MNLKILKYNISAAIALFLLLNGAEELKKQGYIGSETKQDIIRESQVEETAKQLEGNAYTYQENSNDFKSGEKKAKRSIASEVGEKKEHSLNLKEILSSVSKKVKESFMKALGLNKKDSEIKKDKKNKEENQWIAFGVLKDKDKKDKEESEENDESDSEKNQNEKKSTQETDSSNPAISAGLAPVPDIPKYTPEEKNAPTIEEPAAQKPKLNIHNMSFDIFKNEEKPLVFSYNQDQVTANECAVSGFNHLSQVQPCICSNGICSMLVKASSTYVGEEAIVLTLKTAEDTRTKIIKINILPFNVEPVISNQSSLTLLSDETKNLDINISDIESSLACSQIVYGTTSFNIVISGTAPNCVASISHNNNLDVSETISFSISDGEKTTSSNLTINLVRLSELTHNINKDFYPKDLNLPLNIRAKYSNGEEKDAIDFVTITSNMSVSNQVLNMNQIGIGNLDLSYKDVSVSKNFDVFEVLGMNLSEYKLTAPLNAFFILSSWLSLSNGEKFDITEYATWTKNCSKINLNKGKLETIESGDCLISVVWESYNHNVNVSILNNGFDSIEIRGLGYLNIFGQERFKAVGILAGQETDISNHGLWSGDSKTINVGNSYIAMEDGNSQVKFQYGTEEIVKNIEIGYASLVDIDIVLEKNIVSSFEHITLKANGLFDDGRTLDISDSVDWSVNSVVPLIQDNVFYANNTSSHMTYVLSATKNSITKNQNIFFSPSSIEKISTNFSGNIALNSKFNFKVYLNNQDGSSVDISKESLVYSLNNSIINISSNLELYGRSLGTSTIRVKYGLNTIDIPVTVGIPAKTKGNGLLAKYYTGTNFNTYRGQRVEWKVNYDYGTTIKNAIGITELFSVRWTGFFKAPSTGVFVFCTDSDDGVRLKFNNTWIINQWNNHAVRRDCSSVLNLVQGQKYPLELNFYENTGSAVIRLLYGPNTGTQTVVPQELLFVD